MIWHILPVPMSGDIIRQLEIFFHKQDGQRVSSLSIWTRKHRCTRGKNQLFIDCIVPLYIDTRHGRRIRRTENNRNIFVKASVFWKFPYYYTNSSQRNICNPVKNPRIFSVSSYMIPLKRSGHVLSCPLLLKIKEYSDFLSLCHDPVKYKRNK